jgi:hypothetical protein
MNAFFGTVLSERGTVIAKKVEINLGKSVVLTDEIFDPTLPYELQGPGGWRAKVFFIAQIFIHEFKPVHFRIAEVHSPSHN